MTAQEIYKAERERLAEMFMCSALAGNCECPSPKAAFEAAEDFLAELRVRNDALKEEPCP